MDEQRSLQESLGFGEPTHEGLIDIVDHLLDKGCVVTGELILGLADIDLVYVELSLLLCAADRVLPRLLPNDEDGRT